MGGAGRDKLLTLNDRLNAHLAVILRCTVPSERYGRLLLASPPDTRYPYVYPRDTACALQLFRRLAGSRRGYEAASPAFELMASMAAFMADVQSEDGHWGQRYALDGTDKSLYKQEDNTAHGLAILCNYLLTARRLRRHVPDADRYLRAIERGLHHAHRREYRVELNLFRSTTAVHESAIEEGYTCWVNFAYLYAFSLAREVAGHFDHDGIICREHIEFWERFHYSVSELFMAGRRYVRRIDPLGRMDMRPDATLLSPFYFGFLNYPRAMEASAAFLEKQLWDPELGMIMRYLPFDDDTIHVHAGNGPWLQYTAMLAQFHYWNGDVRRGDDLLAAIDRWRTDRGEIPEHLSTCRRFEDFRAREWRTGRDFAKEFDRRILLDDVEFDTILEEANNMARAYHEAGARCADRAGAGRPDAVIRFAAPLMWAHVEYARALLVRAGDWWKMKR